MKPCLADVNILLALLAVNHEHHKTVLDWFDNLAVGEVGLCRIVQLALIRLLGNRSIMGSSILSATAAWTILESLSEDERVEFVSEPTDIASVIPTLLKYPIPTAKLVTDAYLAAFAIASSRRLVTLDEGFRQFKSLDVQLLR